MSQATERTISLIEEFNNFLRAHVDATVDEINDARETGDADLANLMGPQNDFAKKVNSRFSKMKNEIATMHGF